MKAKASLAGLLLLLSCVLLAADSKLPPPALIQVGFKQHVRPILEQKCYSCHGPKQQQSGLRLDDRQAALRGGDYGPVIIPGKSADSKLILRLVSGDGGMQMPPTGALSAEDIGILRAWIDQGGEYEVDLKEPQAPKPVDPRLKAMITAARNQDLRRLRKLVAANPALVQARDAGGSTLLHHAAAFGAKEMLELLLNAGAEVNARNGRGAAALHWAVSNEGRTRLLLERGAAINSQTDSGRTALYLAASQSNHDAVLRLLLDKGADPNLATLNGRSPLMAAAGAGELAMVRLLLERKANPKAAMGNGSTALFDAARSRNVAVIRSLLDAGAGVNTQTKRRETALGVAAMQGSEDIVNLLLERGAEVNVQDERGYSPLMYAAYSEAMPAGIVRTLLAKGADTRITGEGETALSLAGKRGDNEVARLLGVPEVQRQSGGAAPVARHSAGSRPIAEAVQMALSQLEKQSPTFLKRSGCNSCHNQYLPAAAMVLARERGLPVAKSLAEVSLEMREVSPERVMDLDTFGVTSLGYEMFRSIANGQPADEYTDAVVHFIKVMQTPAGDWENTGNRPPLTYDRFITAALAINTLRTYTPAAQRADTEKRLARAAAWLEAAKPVTTQERAFHLLGLLWAKGGGAAIERAARELAQTQRPDGGWSQLPTMGSDAYATGEALYALHLAGKMPTTDAGYQKGVQYLRQTQAADGTWHVKTRSIPLQPYFESGFPYGHDQWISAAGTSWAAMALTLTIEPQKMSRR
jgi:ankyrin repeat protein